MTRVWGTAGLTRAALAAALCVGVAAGGCAEEADAPEVSALAESELARWEAHDVHEHTPASEYDQVAAAPAPDGAVWFTRAGRGDGLAVWTLTGGRTSEAAVATPAGVTIPVGVAADDAGWTAVAVTRDQPGGANTGAVAWRRVDGASQVAQPEALTASAGVPASITVGRSGGASVVAGLVDGAVATWVSTGGPWTPGLPDLDIGRVVSTRVTGTSAGFVLAAVADDGRPYLWASPDGRAWSRLDVPAARAAPTVAAVGMLTPVAGNAAAVAWLAGEVAEEASGDGAEVVVQQVQGTTVTPYGTISAEPGDGVDRIDVNGAARRGDWLLVSGAVVAPDGSVRPGLWAGADGDWGRSSQGDLVGQPGFEVRTIGASGDGELYGILTERGGIDVHVWRSPAGRG